jgi:hypothetical protein
VKDEVVQEEDTEHPLGMTVLSNTRHQTRVVPILLPCRHWLKLSNV